ncbi:MarR family winged helix-turn-helix transcriptional regulator [Arthrobacter burdickii]|jgi:DNA-binding MarR family transcriptional regulator|uniref:MarR family transcriptional regulator n=1 Tax=Arthrobacter burdickii TaxID=3035920 RepID=A0ABT8JYS6_9MICC|nr:MarR family transcriptional regulator [Arthrobacter burdickii]MDN4610329.1 MarR family transcriptional regulator [Arthrobacter burdickii]
MATKDELLVLLRQFTIETDRYVEAASERDSLYRTDLQALGIMMGAASAGLTVTPGLLREELNLSSPATTALVDRLDSAGHVTRRRSDVDRRQVHLEMTEKARATGAMLFAPLARHISGVFDQYSDEQLALLLDMMRKVTDATVAAKNEARDDVGAS